MSTAHISGKMEDFKAIVMSRQHLRFFAPAQDQSSERISRGSSTWRMVMAKPPQVRGDLSELDSTRCFRGFWGSAAPEPRRKTSQGLRRSCRVAGVIVERMLLWDAQSEAVLHR